MPGSSRLSSPSPEVSRRRFWRALTLVICAVAGVIFATSARTSHGTELRSPQSANLRDLVRAAEADVAAQSARLASLQNQVSTSTDDAARRNAAVAAAQAQAIPLRDPAGLGAVTGPGITVVLDDASGNSGGANQAGVDPNQLVVHQSDLQAVVNALWAGGAEAMTISGQRVIATSAVRCVGNTLLMNGRVFSPPFRVAAIGPFGTMRMALDRSPGVTLFKQAAGYYGLGFTVAQTDGLKLPAYSGPVSLSYAKAAA
jgi:uncharacterized protein YlxW (UPF0749 family)